MSSSEEVGKEDLRAFSERLKLHFARETAIVKPESWPHDRLVPAASNRKGPRLASSKFRGCTKHRRTKRYEAHIWDERQQRYLGGFDKEEHAGKAHDVMALKCRNPNIRPQLNFPMENYADLIPFLDRLPKDEVVAQLRQLNRTGPRQKAKLSTHRPAAQAAAPEAQPTPSQVSLGHSQDIFMPAQPARILSPSLFMHMPPMAQHGALAASMLRTQSSPPHKPRHSAARSAFASFREVPLPTWDRPGGEIHASHTAEEGFYVHKAASCHDSAADFYGGGSVKVASKQQEESLGSSREGSGSILQGRPISLPGQQASWLQPEDAREHISHSLPEPRRSSSLSRSLPVSQNWVDDRMDQAQVVCKQENEVREVVQAPREQQQQHKQPQQQHTLLTADRPYHASLNGHNVWSYPEPSLFDSGLRLPAWDALQAWPTKATGAIVHMGDLGLTASGHLHAHSLDAVSPWATELPH